MLYRTCAVHLYGVLDAFPLSEPAEESHHVPLRLATTPPVSHYRLHVLQLVLDAVSALDVIFAVDRLLPVNGRLGDVSDERGSE